MPREREEGKLDGVSLLQREFMTEEPGDSQVLERARVKIRDTCAANLIRLTEMRQRAGSVIRTTARFVWAHTVFVWDMYQTGRGVGEFDRSCGGTGSAA